MYGEGEEAEHLRRVSWGQILSWDQRYDNWTVRITMTLRSILFLMDSQSHPLLHADYTPGTLHVFLLHRALHGLWDPVFFTSAYSEGHHSSEGSANVPDITQLESGRAGL